MTERFDFQEANKHAFATPRRIAPESCRLFSRPHHQRAQGMPDARCTRGLVCNGIQECAHEHTGQRRQSDIPCAMALRLAYNALSPVTGFLATVISGT